MQSTVEIINRFDQRKDLRDLVYDRTLTGFTYLPTRVYHLVCTGAFELLPEFVRRVLADDISQEVRIDQAPAFPAAVRCLDVSLKPTILDLEKEYTSRYLDLFAARGLIVESLTIAQRYYLFAPTAISAETALNLNRAFVTFGPVNPVIHRYQEINREGGHIGPPQPMHI